MDLLEALKVIVNECKKHDTCDSCPMRDKFDECALQNDPPDDWVFKDNEVVPRLFV